MQHLLFICGMPGSGKSTFGKRLANKILCNFYDLDKCIEKFQGHSATSIIQDQGENAFRVIEAEVLRGISFQLPSVVACGGGTPCYYDNLTWMKQHGTVLFLDVPLITLYQRVLQDDGLKKRPLLGANSDEASTRLGEIWKERESYFKQIDWWENGISINMNVIVQKLKALGFSEA